MRSIFVNPPMGRYDMGRFGFPAQHPTLKIRLGGSGLGQSASEIADLIAKLPIERRKEYQDRLDSCLARPALDIPSCIYQLFQDVKRVVESGGSQPYIPPPGAATASAGGFPILPVAIAVVAVGGLAYFISTRGKK